ncbi:MAG: FMN-binding glutamate synthase family protein, partial [Burkholderiaceae bacterium]
HPQDITAFHISQRVSEGEVRLLANVVPRVKTGSLLDDNIDVDHKVYKNYWHRVSADSFALQIK